MSFPSIKRNALETLQVNLGYKCNQACIHCHVDASPFREEMMNEHNIKLIPKIINQYLIKTLDLTGGAPEMHPLFKSLITEVSKLGIEIIDRCNLTILKEKGYEDMAKFLAHNKVRIIASLPCYLEENVDAQRGKSVFQKSIESLKLLNSLGYAKKDKGLKLDLVYNPTGANLPPPQKQLEDTYKYELKKRYDIDFNNLLVLANMPIKRFSNFLKKEGKLEEYKLLLRNNHNDANLNSVMCKNTISVDWEGKLFDCDFNQQLSISSKIKPNTLEGLSKDAINIRGIEISVDNHCFGCTAGNGSSCGGALT
ncbi:arsenosugar biosynthesis radical SAM (seleno)protein ArsS [Prochlorococcus marinus]|uniref:arsenosugar biosynthesis radical SAM (seleno)protein ArsS n=1 Tax=Prochlorococcus marinus TaxID=1219 RepID=UPI0022B52D85|nr:arsenosugar biosynthesis radical SAM (seleno)protein ArsS [Prochlorococcus marinus]